MSPCAVETSLQQKPHQSPEGEWNLEKRGLTSGLCLHPLVLLTNQEDIFISLFVKAFYKKRHPFSRFINRAVQRFYF